MGVSHMDPTQYRYDSELQMYVEPEPMLRHDILDWLKWMVETGRLVGDTIPED